MRRRTESHRRRDGFSLVEMMIGLALVTIIVGSTLLAFTRLEGVYQNTQRTVDLHSDLRGALALMEQEINQAGMFSFASRTLSTAVTLNANAQSVTLSSASGIFVGEKLLIDTRTSEEVVTVTAVNAGSNSISAVFTKNHASGAVVNAVGVFPAGVLSSSSANQLQLFGDINADGTLVYVRYDCNFPTGATGTLTRSSTPITAGTISAASLLVDNLVANPGDTPCFQYGTVNHSGFTFVTRITLTLTAQASKRDSQTRLWRTTTKSLPNLAPHNVLAGFRLAQNSLLNRLQPTPPGLPLQ